MNYEDNNYKVYELNVEKMDMNTHNIIKYFNGYTILEISPYINPIYNKFIEFDTFIFDNTKSNEVNINRFEEQYISSLNNNSLNEEVNIIKYNGIKINSVTIYTTEYRLNNLLYKYDMSIK